LHLKQGHSINIPQVPTQTAQLDLMKEGLFPTERTTMLFTAEYPIFLLLHLIVAIASKKKSNV